MGWYPSLVQNPFFVNIECCINIQDWALRRLFFQVHFSLCPKWGKKKDIFVVTNNHFKVLLKSICEIVLNLYI